MLGFIRQNPFLVSYCGLAIIYGKQCSLGCEISIFVLYNMLVHSAFLLQ